MVGLYRMTMTLALKAGHDRIGGTGGNALFTDDATRSGEDKHCRFGV
jgi:hypothetical protein